MMSLPSFASIKIHCDFDKSQQPDIESITIRTDSNLNYPSTLAVKLRDENEVRMVYSNQTQNVFNEVEATVALDDVNGTGQFRIGRGDPINIKYFAYDSHGDAIPHGGLFSQPNRARIKIEYNGSFYDNFPNHSKEIDNLCIREVESFNVSSHQNSAKYLVSMSETTTDVNFMYFVGSLSKMGVAFDTKPTSESGDVDYVKKTILLIANESQVLKIKRLTDRGVVSVHAQ